jgi:hypothetical protein
VVAGKESKRRLARLCAVAGIGYSIVNSHGAARSVISSAVSDVLRTCAT